MTVEEVSELPPLERFLYWIRERHKIHVLRKAGNASPWTDDWVLRTVFFTNPYRENDKTTVWFREHVRERLRNEDEVLMATVIFRWFNLIATGELLMGHKRDLLVDWDEGEAVTLLQKASAGGRVPVFTGAYMIKAGNGAPGVKIPSVCAAISNVWDRRQYLVSVCKERGTLESLWSELVKFKHLGPFMSYEIVCDVRYTYLLDEAPDVDTWANPGPGAMRGLLRLEGGKIPMNNRNGPKRAVTVPNALPKMRSLLKVVRERLSDMPHFELREVEHSLCEFDKYERARTGEGGRIKRVYNA